jgi:hypothetical protein
MRLPGLPRATAQEHHRRHSSTNPTGDFPMAKMKAAMAAVLVMEKEGITQAFGVPGAAINPLYSRGPRPATSACASAPRGRPAPT